MSTEVGFFSAGTLAVPAHIQAAFDGEANITSGVAIPQLRFKGKVWRIDMAGEETILTRKDAEGEDVAIPVMRLVILGHNPKRSRAYFASAYDSSKEGAPVCWSANGETPDADVQEPCSTACASCQYAAKGSKITDNGKSVAACSTFRNLAVVPSAQLDFSPLRLRLPITSLYDATNAEQEAKGWYAYDQYLKMLRSKGVTHTAAIITKVKFDSAAEYPKLLFSAADWVSAADATKVKGILTEQNTLIEELMGTAPVKAALPKAAPAAAPAAVEEDDDEDDDTPVAEVVAPAPKPTPKAEKPKAVPKAEKPKVVKPAVVEAPVDEDDEEAPAAAPAAAGKSDALKSLLDAWDD